MIKSLQIKNKQVINIKYLANNNTYKKKNNNIATE